MPSNYPFDTVNFFSFSRSFISIFISRVSRRAHLFLAYSLFFFLNRSSIAYTSICTENLLVRRIDCLLAVCVCIRSKGRIRWDPWPIARGAQPTMQECLDPRNFSTTRLLFFCSHTHQTDKKGSSNFDLLAFFFHILLSTIFISIPRFRARGRETKAPSLAIHGQAASFLTHRPSQVVNGVFPLIPSSVKSLLLQ